MANKRLWLWFLGLMAVYFIARYLRTNVEDIPNFFKYHFTDLLYIPTVSTFALIFVRLLKRDNTITISPWLVAFLVVFMSVYFEWYLPTYRGHIHPYTSDIWDIIMYALGGIGFLLIQGKHFK